MLRCFKSLFILISFIFTMSCSSDYRIHTVPEIITGIKIPDKRGGGSAELDVLLVLDNSCSMAGDWDYISYGLTQTPEELNDYEFDWRLGITSADPTDGSFVEVFISDNPGWDMVAGIDSFRDEAGGYEQGFEGALRARNENPDFFREGVTTLVVFVSDEHEQSEMEASDFHMSWKGPRMVASIVGPKSEYTDGPDCAEEAPKYHEASQVTIDICINEPWSLVEQVVE